ncbi:MAG: RsmB/NOP family class I SAM-dependent RNA methyltransferase [Planktotalea sp.]|uniref:RsmB/NOP family class I SAM-dependent RNA methyltransferase n=1 Tax=Planktotalea sp. TaxID=2029877 RepID=UPI003C72E6B0
MTPGARVQAAIECLDDIFAGTPAEKTLTGWARRSRFAGSKDRAAVRDYVYDALRNRDSCAEIGGALNGRAVMLGLVQLQGGDPNEVFHGEGHAPDALSAEEIARLAKMDTAALQSCLDSVPDMPDVYWHMLQASHPEKARAIAQALRARAPVDLRVNLQKSSLTSAQAHLLDEGITSETSDIASTALRVTGTARGIKNAGAYLDGLIELQDAGSQALIEWLPLADGMEILDYCAGGGGKSLAIAGLSKSKLFAHDQDAARMKDIPVRAKRAGASITCLSTATISQHAPFDIVLCDAPCSGSGAWRRSPDAKWRLDPIQFQNLLSVQLDILSQAQNYVRPGGYLAYATCSLFAEENEQQVKRFLETAPNFKRIAQKSWTPLDGCDGFHICVLQLAGEQNNLE